MSSSKTTKRSVVITGCTKGLGLEMAKSFAIKGWHICGCGRSATAIDSLSTSMEGEHFFAQADVTDDSAVAQFAAAAISKFGAPDLLLNNAGMINDPAPLWEVSAADFDRITATNINGVANVIRHFLPEMIARGSGVVVNFSSGWGRGTSPDVAPYCATKWAVEGLTSALAQELPTGLAAVALNPGIIDTQMLRKCWSDAASDYDDPATWAETAVPMLEKLSAKDNGRQLTAP